MRAQTDFHLTVDAAAGHVLDATCSARAAIAGPLPTPHRRLMQSAIRKLEAAQLDLFNARNNPWGTPPPKQRQLALL